MEIGRETEEEEEWESIAQRTITKINYGSMFQSE